MTSSIQGPNQGIQSTKQPSGNTSTSGNSKQIKPATGKTTTRVDNPTHLLSAVNGSGLLKNIKAIAPPAPRQT